MFFFNKKHKIFIKRNYLGYFKGSFNVFFIEKIKKKYIKN